MLSLLLSHSGIITSEAHRQKKHFAKPAGVLWTHAGAKEGKAGTDTSATASFLL